MLRIIFGIIVLVFLVIWWIKNFLRPQKDNSSKAKNSLKKPIISQESLSEFQQWVLKEADTLNPNELEGNFKEAFDHNDWNKLEPSLYAKWSKFYWDI